MSRRITIEERHSGYRLYNATGSVDVMGRSVDECLSKAAESAAVGGLEIHSAYEAAEVLESLMGRRESVVAT